MKNGFMKSLSDSKNMKYTTVNVAFCALIIAIVMIVNAMLTIFTEKFNWYLDMTDEKIFTMSSQMKNALDEMFEDNDAEIEIISFEMTDIITTSLIGDNAGNGEDDEIVY